MAQRPTRHLMTDRKIEQYTIHVYRMDLQQLTDKKPVDVGICHPILRAAGVLVDEPVLQHATVAVIEQVL